MEFLKHSIAIAPALLLATSCISDFEPQVESDPVLCMNSLITADSPVFVNLTHTWHYSSANGADFNNHFYESLIVDDAKVRMIINETDTFDLEYTDLGYISGYRSGKGYISEYVPAAGDKVTLSADSPRYGRAEATVTIPQPTTATLDRWKAAATQRDLDGGSQSQWISFTLRFALDVRIALTDRSESTDYYMVRWRGSSPDILGHGQTIFAPGALNYDAEPLFGEHIGILETIMGSDGDGFTAFSDNQLSGKTRNINLRFDNCYASTETNTPDKALDCSLNIDIDHISQSYYEYLIYDWQLNEGIIGSLGDIGFADQIFARSNVSTGAGIVAARTTTPLTISLESYLMTELKDAH